MNREEFESFVQTARFNGKPLNDQMEETHISWISFTKKYVFKIKKPVKLSFLDFSTLGKRKRFCEKELMLNQRFSKIYLDVLPVIMGEKGWCLGKEEGDIVDYAVQMKRMASSKRMDKMLQENKVGKGSMQALAEEVAFFHKKAEVIKTPFDRNKAKALFNDIGDTGDFIQKELGQEQKEFIHRSMNWSNEFLEGHAQRFQDRIERGFKRDLHGDLHAGNIFLYQQPVLFDCIEFNDEFRQIDLLYEIAFLCMELEAKGHQEFSDQFLSTYCKKISCLETDEDTDLYLYFKCLRANVRAKVRSLSIKESSGGDKNDHLKAINIYLSLMGEYMRQIEG
ncbi:MAG: hypothetical protein WD426_02155 [Anditalea sp.]